MRDLPRDDVMGWLARVATTARGDATPAQRVAQVGLKVVDSAMRLSPDPWAPPRLARGVGAVDASLVLLSDAADRLASEGITVEERFAALEDVARLAIVALAHPDLATLHSPDRGFWRAQAPDPDGREPDPQPSPPTDAGPPPPTVTAVKGCLKTPGCVIPDYGGTPHTAPCHVPPDGDQGEDDRGE